MKAIVVEDDTSVQTVFRAWFEKAGFSVETASSRLEAEILLARNPPPEVITVDINLLDIQGEQTFAWIEAIRLSHPNALLLVVSGVLKPADVPRLAKLGADGAFEKMDVTIEKSWWQKILDAISGIGKQEPLNRNLKSLESVAEAVKHVYNATGASLRLSPAATVTPSSIEAVIATSEKSE